MADVRFEWNKNSGQIIYDKGFDKDLQVEFAKIVLKYGFPFTPYSKLTGKQHLRDAVFVQGRKQGANITYFKPYTRKQYTIKYSHTGPTSANHKAVDHWIEYGFATNQRRITKEINDYRKKHAK